MTTATQLSIYNGACSAIGERQLQPARFAPNDPLVTAVATATRVMSASLTQKRAAPWVTSIRAVSEAPKIKGIDFDWLLPAVLPVYAQPGRSIMLPKTRAIQLFMLEAAMR